MIINQLFFQDIKITFLKKYCAYYLKKEKIYTIQEIKKNIIALEHDITKIHQNFKSIS